MSWQYIPLGNLVDIKGGGTPSRIVESYWNGGIPWATVKDFKSDIILATEENISELGAKESATNIIPAGTIIIPTRMALGKVAITGTNVAINQDLKALTLKTKKITTEFLFWFLRHAAEAFDRAGKGATVKGITVDFLKSVEVPLPPLEIQKHIARVLEQADQLRKQAQQMESELNQLAQSLFLEMFGDPVANAKQWPCRQLSDIASTQLGKMLSQKAKTGASSRKYLRNANIRWRTIDLGDLLEMDFSDKEMKKFELKAGDLLVCEGGEVGRCAIWRNQLTDCYYQKALHRVRVKSTVITSEYLQEYFYWMATLGGLASSVSEVTFSHLTEPPRV